jgi:hypothetical protein
MGKQSRRNRNSAPSAPRTLNPELHPFYNSMFKPIPLSSDLLANDAVQSMQRLVQDGWLTSWDLGRKGTHISSHFIVKATGDIDTLTSPNPNDQDFGALTGAHIGRAFQLLRKAHPPRS